MDDQIPAAASVLVSVRGLGKRFSGVVALDALDFELRAGEVVGLLGPNGAGKTTTLKLLLGLLRPSAGHAQVLGLDCTHDTLRVKERVGFTPDEPQFYDFLTGRETLDFTISARGLAPEPAWEALREKVALFAPSNWSATTACAAALAVCFESHRAARLNVRWIDDPADDVERETTVWRALLAASAFFALQAVSYRILTIAKMPSGYALATAFASSAVLLALLTWRNDARIERPSFLPRSPVYWLLGALAGAASGTLALGLARIFPPPSDTPLPEFGGGEVVAMALTMTVIAPLVEEYFFRGWLQRAIAADLPEGKKHWAFVLGASAFALAHLGSYGIPQLVLGLLAGALFATGGGLWPAIVAHALHNGVVLWFGK
jgi:membrane protease YdiL (CAAX protease family)